MTASQVVCGIDAGATWSKGGLFEVTDGITLLAAASGGPGNPNSVGETMAVSNLSGLLLQLHLAAGRDPRATDAVGIGISTTDVGHRAGRLVLPHLDAVCVPDVVLLAADRSSSVVSVVAGTGSIAARVDGDVVTSAGGHGWFLGDEGSATSIGRDTIRLVLSGAATGELCEAVAAHINAPPGAGLEAHIYEWVYRTGAPQHQVPTLAPTVTDLARAGDPSAAAVADAAADALVALATELAHPSDELVFGGSVAVALTGALVDRLGTPVAVHPDGVPGAAWLAADRSTRLESWVSAWDGRDTARPPWPRRGA